MSTRASWIAWLLVTFLVGSYCVFSLAFDNQSLYLPGRTSDGHYQLELSCKQCHTPFGGVAQDACIKCHRDKSDEEGTSNKTNSHAASKFNDPRNADRIAALDARKCMTCHVEHWPEGTHRGGYTVAEDFCVKCHADVGTERPSHAGMSFFSCSDAGCHNYHDNRAANEDFLTEHLGEPPVLAKPAMPLRASEGKPRLKGLRAADQDAPASVQAPQAVAEWEESAHARAGVNCSACHGGANGSTWNAKPTRTACTGCHGDQDRGFLAGKHGMRQAAGLGPMLPAMARLPMNGESKQVALDCNTCHGTHRYDTRRGAVDSCLGCHADEHSQSYRRSPHFKLWEKEIAGTAAPGTGVSCATCHLPREKREGSTVVVQHNQNDNLRPNEKMVRNVCAACHGVGFSLDSIADEDLVRHNFDGRPAKHVASIDMVEKRAKSRKEGR
jgi:hypothetical protein